MPPKKSKGKAGKGKAAAGRGKAASGKGNAAGKGKAAKATAKATSTRVETAEGSHVTTEVKAEAAAATGAPLIVSAEAPKAEEAVEAKVEVELEVEAKVEVEPLDPVDEVPDPWANGAIVAGESGDTADTLLADVEESGVWLKLGDCELGTFTLNDTVRARLTALDLSNNSLVEGVQPPDKKSLPPGCAWLRFLSLQANPISKCPDLAPYAGCLLWLDLSFCECSFSTSDFLPLGSCLRHLTMDSCTLGSLLGGGGSDGAGAGVPIFSGLQCLRHLSLQDNDFDEMSSDFQLGLAGLSTTLTELDLRENEICDKAGYQASVLECLRSGSALKVLDNKILNTTSNVKSLGDMQGLADTIAARGVADDQEDHSSCSCLEGNPCADKNCCKDWKNRFEIAARIRAGKLKFSLGEGVIDTMKTDMKTGAAL